MANANSKEPINDVVFAKFINYMKKALLHKKINYLRNLKKINEREIPIDKIENSIYNDKEESTGILETILSSKERDVLKFHILEKRTYEEIAKKLKMQPESVRKIKYRAIKKIIKWRNDNENRIS